MDPPGDLVPSKSMSRNRLLFRAGRSKNKTSHRKGSSGSSIKATAGSSEFFTVREEEYVHVNTNANTSNNNNDDILSEDVFEEEEPPSLVQLPPAVLRQQIEQQQQQQQQLHHHQHHPWRQNTASSSLGQSTASSISAGADTTASSSNSLFFPQRHRKSLRKKAPSLSQYQITPITKHYELSRQILAAFDSHWTNHLWVTAYAVGLQFVETALLEIPKHGYFYSARHERERMESSLEAARVTHLLHDLLLHQQEDDDNNYGNDNDNVLDPTAGLVPSGDLQHVEKLQSLALEQVEQASSDQDQASGGSSRIAYQTAREEVEDELRYDGDVSTTGDWIVCEPLLACSESFSTLVMPSAPDSPSKNSVLSATYSLMSMTTRAPPTPPPPPPPPPITNQPNILMIGEQQPPAATMGTAALSRSLALQEQRLQAFAGMKNEPTDWLKNSDNSSEVLAMPQYRSSVSVCSSVQTTEELLLEKALFLSGLEVSVATEVGYPRNEECPPPPEGTLQSSAGLELSTLAQLYHEDFDSLQQTRRVRVSLADTFQGRKPGSTNGCTVIAPLLCIHHLMSKAEDCLYETGGDDPGLSDSTIVQVIDTETPVVLTQLRRQLRLAEHAFLIPADAHDYLLDSGQMSPDQFHTVTGGNILHDGHLTAFVSGLEDAKNEKIAASLFFHEHVVTILKLRRMDGKGRIHYWYDFIDSLPLKETLRRYNESSHDLCQRLGLLTGLSDEEIDRENQMIALPRTARIRCLDAEALTAVIRWYACSKFNDENIAYIDQYPWDDTACDFDPRVFQAFVWRGIEFDDKVGAGQASF